MRTAADTAWIVERARELGFAMCGVAPLRKFAEHEAFAEWLERGYAGEMAYLADQRRSHPEKVLDTAGSVIVCALNYNTAHPYSTEAAQRAAINGKENETPRGWISRYAWGQDYHEVMWERLNVLLECLGERFSERHFARAYADTGPVAERIFAKYAGLGWIGKNTLLLDEKLGSWFFLGVIVTSLELASSLAAGEMPPADLCGNCRQCLDACPTQALIEPYVMDARKCISYLTIELRGGIPVEFREPIGRNVYGCDICQDVCPYNREAPVTEIADFAPRSWPEGRSLLEPQLEWLAGMSAEEFREKFRGSAMKRTKWRGLVRNASIALGNQKLRRGSPEHARIVALLQSLNGSAEPAIAESAQWALSRIT
jgi:epoxyqueuosine reductase